MSDPKMQIATDLAITDVLTANAIQTLDNNDLEPTAEISASHVCMNEPCSFPNCRVGTSGYITSQSANIEPVTPQNVNTMAKKKKANAYLDPHLPTDPGTAHQIQESKEDFDNGKSIISQSLEKDLLAIQEVETYLNQKEIFLETSKDSVHWQQDQAHDQMRFHFVMPGRKDDRSEWLASDARYVRTRLAELVGNLACELKILKATVNSSQTATTKK